jgi:hypothetical protein
VAPVEDVYYPAEERDEEQAAAVPTVVSACQGSCVLRVGTKSVNAVPGDLVFGNWVVLSVTIGPEDRFKAMAVAAPEAAPIVTIERRFKRWGLLVFTSVAGEKARVRKPLGQLSLIKTPVYNFSADPDYFRKAAVDPHDYLGTRMRLDSPFGEPDFLTAAKYLPPISDYVVTGDVRAPVKAIVTMDGKIKRTDGADHEPPSAQLRKASGRGRRENGRRRQDVLPMGTQIAEVVADGTDGKRVESTNCTSDPDCWTIANLERAYCSKGQCVGGGTTIFDAVKYLKLAVSKGVDTGASYSFDNMQTGVLGGYMRVASVACFDAGDGAGGRGFEMLSLGPLKQDNDTVLIALRQYIPGAKANASFAYLSVSLSQQRCVDPGTGQQACASTAGDFYAAVFEHVSEWQSVFGDGRGSKLSPGVPVSAATTSTSLPMPDPAHAMQVRIPYAERRQVDMAKGVLVAASTVYIGDEPNYGTGGHYWKSSPPARAMLDTSGVADSLPLTTLALDNALLQWGVHDSALSKIGFYLDTFIYPNGSIDMGHWKDVWADAGVGKYNCTFPDSLTDQGRILQLYTDAVRMTRNLTFMAAHLAPAVRLAGYLLRARQLAVEKFGPGDPRHGLIYGPAEHDTCAMGRGDDLRNTTAAEVVDGQYMLYYYSVSMWSWRGMQELGRLLLDYPQVAEQQQDEEELHHHQHHHPRNTSFGRHLLDEAALFKIDIDRSLEQAVLRDKTTDEVLFVPSAAVPANTTVKPYPDMTYSTVATYSNFRYYSEMLSAGFMSPSMSIAMMNFRETHGGLLSGMTRYTDHLDDMPAIGYAISSLAADRLPSFLTLLYGHAANYMGRGSFFTTEQQSLYQLATNPRWRATLGEIQDDFCTPSQTLVSSMTAMQLIHSERDNR